MHVKPYVNRRSFLARVVGTSLLGGGALSAVVGKSHAQQNLSRSCLTDRDSGDRPDYGRQTGLTDTDPTNSAGRGTLTNRTDSDATDAENRGRSWRCANRTGVTDGDSGANADLAGFGLGRRTGVTDSQLRRQRRQIRPRPRRISHRRQRQRSHRSTRIRSWQRALRRHRQRFRRQRRCRRCGPRRLAAPISGRDV